MLPARIGRVEGLLNMRRSVSKGIVTILYVCYYHDDNNHYLIIAFQVPVVRVEICFESLTKISGQGRLGAPQVQVILMMVGISVVLA